jgi:hypothetical protein
MWSVPSAAPATFTWEYDAGRIPLDRLYDAAQRRQWNAADRLDWSLPVDPTNPLGFAPDTVPIAGSEIWERLGATQRDAVVQHLAAWQCSQFLHGEQGGLICAAKIVEAAPDLDSKLMAATQVVDEARHVELFARFIDEHLVMTYPMHSSLAVILETILGHPSWDMPFLAQVLVEGLGLAAFGMVRDSTSNQLVRSLTAYVMEDEARHVAFSRVALADCYRSMNESERREREDFCIEATAQMQDRFLAHEVWEVLELDVDACTAYVEHSAAEQAFRKLLFSRIVPTLRDIGLLTARVREHLARLGVSELGVVDLDRTARADALAARMAGAARRDATPSRR